MSTRFKESGTKFRIYAQRRHLNLKAFRRPAVVYLDAAPGTTTPGPADDRMCVVDAIKKTPYLESGAHPRYSGPPPVAYLLYEKGRSLVSLFAFPSQGLALPDRGWVRVGDGRFYVTEVKGAEVVLWTQGGLAYALVSSLDRQALLECADTVWRLVVSNRAPGA